MDTVAILIITYKRTELALRTVRALKKNLIYPPENLIWHISDDGSQPPHVSQISNEIGSCTITNANRRGVGHSMNLGMVECLDRSDHILWLEDDWELNQPLNLEDHIQLFKQYPDIGMVRFGYLSPGLLGELIACGNHLWWKLQKGPQYTFVGHASLRTREFCKTYGMYNENLAPGATELNYCGRFNYTLGPTVAVPCWGGEYGFFSHIGGESLKDMVPDVK